jgi:hypothetical protein
LELEPHGQGVALGLRGAAAGPLDLVGDAQQVLDVVADLVRDHVRLREVAGRAQALAEQLVEREVDVHLLVAGAVERPHVGGRAAARGRDLAIEEHELRALVLAAAGGELLGPELLDVIEHEAHELHLVAVRVLVSGDALAADLRAGELVERHVDAEAAAAALSEHEIGDGREDERGDAEPAADGQRHPRTATAAALVDHIAARPTPDHFHASSVRRRR